MINDPSTYSFLTRIINNFATIFLLITSVIFIRNIIFYSQHKFFTQLSLLIIRIITQVFVICLFLIFVHLTNKPNQSPVYFLKYQYNYGKIYLLIWAFWLFLGSIKIKYSVLNHLSLFLVYIVIFKH